MKWKSLRIVTRKKYLRESKSAIIVVVKYRTRRGVNLEGVKTKGNRLPISLV
jgi:hypothetical protein